MTSGRLEQQIMKMVRLVQLGGLLPDEAAWQLRRLLDDRRDDTPPLVVTWQLRVVLAAVLRPRGYYQAFALHLPPAIAPAAFDVDLGAGWTVGEAAPTLASTLAVVTLVPPYGDLLSGLSAMYAAPPDGMSVSLGDCNEMEFAPDFDRAALASPGPGVWVAPHADEITVVAHTIPLLQHAVAHLTGRGLGQPPVDAVSAIVRNTLESVHRVLCLRREWRTAHPRWGVMPSGLLQVLRTAPQHFPAARGWRVDGRADDATATVAWVCDEIERLTPTPAHGDDLSAVRDRDTHVIEIIEQWLQTPAS